MDDIDKDCIHLASLLHIAHYDKIQVVRHILKIFDLHWNVLSNDVFLMKLIIDIAESHYHYLNRKQETLLDSDWNVVFELDRLTKKLKMILVSKDSLQKNDSL